MRVAVIGAGKIGGTLGGRWGAAGHDVVYGVRDPSGKKDALTPGAAIEGAEAVLLAVPGTAVVDFVRQHAQGLDGKVVIDATNNPRGPAMNSWAEWTAVIPRAALYRAFNSLGWEIYANPVVGGQQADLFYAGPEGSGQRLVEQLIADAGLRPIWVGGADQAGTVDAVLRLWFTLAQKKGRRIAFKLLAD